MASLDEAPLEQLWRDAAGVVIPYQLVHHQEFKVIGEISDLAVSEGESHWIRIAAGRAQRCPLRQRASRQV
jgi:hypothetical protein